MAAFVGVASSKWFWRSSNASGRSSGGCPRSSLLSFCCAVTRRYSLLDLFDDADDCRRFGRGASALVQTSYDYPAGTEEAGIHVGTRRHLDSRALGDRFDLVSKCPDGCYPASFDAANY